MLEAMAAKVPLIATKVGVVPDVITKQDEMVSPKDVEQLSHMMEKLYNTPENERVLLGEKLHQRLLAQFDIKSYRKKYLELVQGYIE